MALYDDVKVETRPHTDSTKVSLVATFDASAVLSQQAAYEFVRDIIRLLAERYVKENYADLVSKLDQQAIANMAIAESGKKIA